MLKSKLSNFFSTDTTFYGQTLAAHITIAAERQLKKQTFSQSVPLTEK